MDEYYSSIAPGYDALYGAEQDEKLREFLRRAHIPTKGRILDIGCGTARSAQSFPHLDWHGVEPAQGLVDRAPQSARPYIILARGEALPFNDNEFDVVLSLTALQNYDDAEQGIREMGRVVKSDGILLVSFLKRSAKAMALDAALRKHLRILDSWESAKDMMYICACGT
jgi:ubiquinone/menaquinone biosynthesis C-methylase UbiE